MPEHQFKVDNHTIYVSRMYAEGNQTNEFILRDYEKFL